MACFIAPAAEAIVVSAVRHTHEKHERAHVDEAKEISHEISGDSNPVRQTDNLSHGLSIGLSSKLTFSEYLMTRLRVLSNLLWGGCFLLLIEHIWHGEIVPWFPFFTAVQTPDGTLEMFGEIATVGTTMAVVVTIAWVVGSAVCYHLEKKQGFLSTAVKEG